MAARSPRCLKPLRASISTFAASAARPTRAVPPFHITARTAFSWSNLTSRLGRWTGLGASTASNPLIEQPRETPPLPPPAEEGLPAQVQDESRSIFDRVRPRTPAIETRWAKHEYDFHDHATYRFKVSPRKLNKLARQIGGKPVDYAILQMSFSEKRAARKVREVLMEARDDAQRLKGMERDKLIVAEAWVTKAQTIKRLEMKGRSKTGIREHRYSKIYVRLREGKTPQQLEEERRKKILKRVVSAGNVREDVPLRNVRPMWTW